MDLLSCKADAESMEPAATKAATQSFRKNVEPSKKSSIRMSVRLLGRKNNLNLKL